MSGSAATGSAAGEDEEEGSSRQIAGTEEATGTVTEVSQVADASSGVAQYAVVVSFTDTSGSYNAGASVSVDIAYAELADAISVPSRAVTTTNGASTVEVQTDAGTTTREVETGLTVDAMTEITSGLSAGESVVLTMGGFGQAGMPTGAVPGARTEPTDG